MKLGVSLLSSRGEFLARNALLVLIAAGDYSQKTTEHRLGIHALTDYYDTTPLFIKHMQRLLNGYSGGSVTLSAPFLADTKAEVIRLQRERGATRLDLQLRAPEFARLYGVPILS